MEQIIKKLKKRIRYKGKVIHRMIIEAKQSGDKALVQKIQQALDDEFKLIVLLEEYNQGVK